MHIRNSFLSKRQPELIVREIRLEKQQSRVTRLVVVDIMLIALLVFAANMGLYLIGSLNKTHLRLAYP